MNSLGEDITFTLNGHGVHTLYRDRDERRREKSATLGIGSGRRGIQWAIDMESIE